SRLAPPTRAPSTSSSAMSSRMLSGLTLPPYRMRQAPAASPPNHCRSRFLMCACASPACAAVAVRPVPIAHTGSYAITSSDSCAAVIRSRPSLICRSSTSSVSLRSRSSSVSPTQTIGVNSAAIDVERLVALALLERLADADDRRQLGGDCRERLAVHDCVGLAEQPPP